MAPRPRNRPPIQLFAAHVSARSVELVTEVLSSGWVNEGEVVKQFEARLAGDLGVRNPVAVNSGTAALHLALAVAGVGSDDEVIVPAQTFVATGLAVIMQGAKPVFADIDPETGTICARSVEAKITPRTRAVIPVHWGGYPCDLDEINGIAERAGVVVVEDAAHALGATYRGQPIGSLSRFTAFSFQSIKHLTTGDGGALCCLEDVDTEEARTRRWFGIDRSGGGSSPLSPRTSDIKLLGYKYHMNNVAAAIGLGNLEDFPTRLARRRRLGALYRAGLADVPGLELLRAEADRESAYWIFTILVERRPDFVHKLGERGIPCSVVDLRIDRYSIFGGVRDDLPGQARFEERQISIPLHEALEDADVQWIIETIREGW